MIELFDIICYCFNMNEKRRFQIFVQHLLKTHFSLRMDNFRTFHISAYKTEAELNKFANEIYDTQIAPYVSKLDKLEKNLYDINHENYDF